MMNTEQPPLRQSMSPPTAASAEGARPPRWTALLVTLLAGVAVLQLIAWATPSTLGSRHVVIGPWLDAIQWVSTLVLVSALSVWLLGNRAADRKARRRGARIEAALESQQAGIALYDAAGRMVSCNDAYRALAPAEVIAGRKTEPGAALGRRHGESMSAESLLRVGERWYLATDCRTADGGIVSLRIPVSPRQLHEIELQLRGKTLDELAELTHDWFWRTDAEGRFVEFSAAMPRRFKYTPQQLIGLRLAELPGFGADNDVRSDYAAAVAARSALPWFRIRVLRGDGQPTWLALSGTPVIGSDGDFEGYFGVARDVGEREAAAQALRRSDDRFRALTRLATEWYWETDAQLRFTLVRGPHQLGERLEQSLLASTLFEVIRDFTVDHARVAAAIGAREPFRRLPYVVRRERDGKRLFFEASAEPMFDDGVFTGYRGVSLDVTERELLVEELRASEGRFRALTELASDWYWETDEQLRFTQMKRGDPSRPERRLLEEEVIGKHGWDLPGELIQPASWDEHRATLAARRPFRDMIVRRVARDGAVRYVAVSGDPVFDANGAFRGYRGAGKDVTEQVRAQDRAEKLVAFDALTQLAPTARRSTTARGACSPARTRAGGSARCCSSTWTTSAC